MNKTDLIYSESDLNFQPSQELSIQESTQAISELKSRKKPRIKKDHFRQSVLDSSIEPLTKIVRTKSMPLRLFWLTCFLIGGALTSWFIILKFAELFEYPVITKVRYYKEASVEFPVVAICNANPYQSHFAVDYITEIIENVSEHSLAFNGTFASKKEFLRKYFEKYEYDIRYLISTKSNDSIKKQLGLSLDEMLINCQFNGKVSN